jgi:hypothetical protein
LKTKLFIPSLLIVLSVLVLGLILAGESFYKPKPATSVFDTHTVAAGPQAPTTQLEQMGAVKIAPTEAVKADPKPTQATVKAPAVAPTTTHTKTTSQKSAAEEAAAYAKAKLNGQRADCLRDIVDAKIAYDIKQGVISDAGNALTDACHPQEK